VGTRRDSLSEESRYWDAIVEAWQNTPPQALWRAHSDAINLALLARWLPEGRVQYLLKTDVFDEAVGDGLCSFLVSRAEQVVGMDISLSTLHAVRRRYANLRIVGADTRRLSFADDTFDVIVSLSTLDHFRSRDEIVVSLRELCRVLRPGGHLVLTLDNLANPAVALRNVLPFPLLQRLGIVPYYVGATYGPRLLRRLLPQVGFDVVEVSAVMHCPRVLAVPIARLLERGARVETLQRFSRLCVTFERLSQWPTRFVTSYFVAVRAVKH